MSFEQRCRDLGIVLPVTRPVDGHVRLPFEWARVVGERLVTSGHGSLGPDGRPRGPFGRVPDEVETDEAKASAGRAAVALLATVQIELGSLDRVRDWVSLAVFVQAADGWSGLTEVANVISDVVIDVFGEAGRHTRTTVGATSLPMNFPVVVAAELTIAPEI